MQLEITVCDICRDSQKPTRRYTVSVEGKSGETDRCKEHGAVFEEIVRAPRKPRTTPKTEPVKRQTRRPRVVSVDEVERARR